MIKYELPKLVYAYGDLEPFIDAQTMEIHYSKHHQTYLDKLNMALSTHAELAQIPIEKLLTNVDSLTDELIVPVRNMGGGFYNHNLFWEMLSPSGDSTNKASDELTEKIVRSFVSMEKFKEEFTNKALSLFGSGWTWLVINPAGKLELMNTSNQDNPVSMGAYKILLTLDVWEHAYYLKHQNRRADYVTSWWNVVNWKTVSKNLAN